jgi:hypothetical protein
MAAKPCHRTVARVTPQLLALVGFRPCDLSSLCHARTPAGGQCPHVARLIDGETNEPLCSHHAGLRVDVRLALQPRTAIAQAESARASFSVSVVAGQWMLMDLDGCAVASGGFDAAGRPAGLEHAVAVAASDTRAL